MRAVFESTPSPTGHGVWWKAEVAGGDFVMSGAPTVELALQDARRHCDERGWSFDAAPDPTPEPASPSANGTSNPNRVREELMATLRDHGPATARELADRMGVLVDTMKRRIDRASAAGLVVVVGRQSGHRGGPRHIVGLPGQRPAVEPVAVETPETPRQVTTEARRVAALKADVREHVARVPSTPPQVARALMRNQGEVRQLMIDDATRGRMRLLADGRYEATS